MFGEGVFGPTGALWCCALVIALPTVYAALFTSLLRISFPLAVRTTVLATIILIYFGTGYLFGDVIGAIAAVLTLVVTLPTFVLKTQRTVINMGRERAKRVFRDNMSGGTFIFGEAVEPTDENSSPDL